MARRIIQWTFRRIESPDASATIKSFDFAGQQYRRNRRTWKTIDTKFGAVSLQRWFFQNRQTGRSGVAPLDLRLGLVGDRMTPALAEVTARLAADLPQQATLDCLREHFGVQLGVAAYRRVIEDSANRVRTHHDHVAIETLAEWITAARKSTGETDVLLQVGRDGVYVPTRSSWEEASCGTLAVYGRDSRRVGTVYLGEMPESDQPTMTSRLTTVIEGLLSKIGDEAPTLRYVTDAGCHPKKYFHEVLSKMKHPVTGKALSWSWGVDFFHACEYLSTLAGALMGEDKQRAAAWARKQRRTLRHKANGIERVIRRAAQHKRRHGLGGSEADYDSAIAYLRKYRGYMDYEERASRGEPIGSGITEAGCKVIFNQRMKQSGMRWNRRTGQHIVDLRTARRGRLWGSIWQRILSSNTPLPPITQGKI